MEDLRKFLGSNIARLRKKAGMSQNVLAERADIGFGTLAKIEQGQSWPDFATIEKIADTLGVPGRELFETSPKPYTPSPLEALAALCQDYGFEPPKPRKGKKKSA